MDKTEKAGVVEDFKNRFKGAVGILVADYRGLTVLEVNDLRKAFRKVGVDYSVVKNTLAKLAIHGTELDTLKDWFKGTTAVAISRTDAPAMAKAAVDFAKIHEKFKLRGVFVEGEKYLAEGIKALSELPTKDEIRATLLGVINAPLTQLLAQFNAPAQNLVGVLQAKADKDKDSAPATAEQPAA
jgi:large subunit ribosomal protein L10